jgi:hypothetical protein
VSVRGRQALIRQENAAEDQNRTKQLIQRDGFAEKQHGAPLLNQNWS